MIYTLVDHPERVFFDRPDGKLRVVTVSEGQDQSAGRTISVASTRVPTILRRTCVPLSIICPRSDTSRHGRPTYLVVRRKRRRIRVWIKPHVRMDELPQSQYVLDTNPTKNVRGSR
jgi:hypothetical protein